MLLGVLAGGVVTLWLRRREQRAELRAVARLLVDDLAGTADSLLFVVETKRWSCLPDDAAASVHADAWDRHRLLIAREVSDDEQWRTVADAFRLGRVAGYIVAGALAHADKEDHARDLVAKLRAGANVLRPLAHRDVARQHGDDGTSRPGGAGSRLRLTADPRVNRRPADRPPWARDTASCTVVDAPR